MRTLEAAAFYRAVALVGDTVYVKFGSDALLLLDAFSFAECLEVILLE